MPSDNQFYKMIVICLKLARILMRFFFFFSRGLQKTVPEPVSPML